MHVLCINPPSKDLSSDLMTFYSFYVLLFLLTCKTTKTTLPQCDCFLKVLVVREGIKNGGFQCFQRWSLLKGFAMPLNYVMQILFSWHPHRNNHGRTVNANSQRFLSSSAGFCFKSAVFSSVAFSGMPKESIVEGRRSFGPWALTSCKGLSGSSWLHSRHRRKIV